ncbi:MAG: glycosyltransferase family 4 protein [Treponema sp.]|nr:glycosyltransferase family 4 protein [Treponema sp.]
MKKRKIIINGEVYCRNTTGIERVATDMITALDMLFNNGEAELVIPLNVRETPYLRNIQLVQLDYTVSKFFLWEQLPFQSYVRKNNGIALDFGNACPFFAPGAAYLHDIYCELYPYHFVTRRDRLICQYSRIMYRRIAKKAKKIIAVSEFTKQTIINTYHISPDKIHVIYNGIGPSYKSIQPNFSIFEKHPVLKEKDFYFTLGSLSVRKNLKWIAEHAARYPDEFFVVSGTALKSVIAQELGALRQLKNVLLPGYLSDAEVKALMSRCRAFIFPSLFEGFGLPPLEALSCGAKIIISNRTCLPEIYGDCAYYIDPDRADVNLDALLAKTVAPPDKLLKELTVENASKKLYKIIKDFLS